MRRLLPLVVLAAAACYSPRPVASPGPYADAPYADLNAPLHASLWFDEYTGVAHFDVSRPAHVAIFAFRPGGSMHMLYPSMGLGTRTGFSSGSHIVHTSARSNVRYASGWSTVYGASPTYIIMIASERQLEVDHFMMAQRVNWALRSTFNSSPYMAVETLAEEIVPNPAGEHWTYAMQVVWPQSAWPDRSNTPWYVHVSCPNGVVLTVPAEVYQRGWVRCPTNQPGLPGDSTAVPAEGGIRGALPGRPGVEGDATGEGSVRMPHRPIGPQRGTGEEADGIAGGITSRPTPPGWMAGGRPTVDSDEEGSLGRVIRGIRSTRGIDHDDRGSTGVMRIPIRGRSGSDWQDELRGRMPARPSAARPGRSVHRPTSRPELRPRSGGDSRPTPAARPANRPVVKPAARPAPPPRPKPAERPKPKPKPKPSSGGNN